MGERPWLAGVHRAQWPPVAARLAPSTPGRVNVIPHHPCIVAFLLNRRQSCDPAKIYVSHWTSGWPSEGTQFLITAGDPTRDNLIELSASGTNSFSTLIAVRSNSASAISTVNITDFSRIEKQLCLLIYIYPLINYFRKPVNTSSKKLSTVTDPVYSETKLSI